MTKDLERAPFHSKQVLIFYRSLIIYFQFTEITEALRTEAKLSEGNQEELLILEMNRTRLLMKGWASGV